MRSEAREIKMFTRFHFKLNGLLHLAPNALEVVPELTDHRGQHCEARRENDDGVRHGRNPFFAEVHSAIYASMLIAGFAIFEQRGR